MKTTIKRMLWALIALPLLLACKDEEPEYAEGLSETIYVSGATGYRKSTFAEGARIFSNRAYKVSHVPDYFNGFEMLTSNARANNGGTITAQTDGLVYIVAPASVKPEGWTVVPNTVHEDWELNYATTDQVVKLAIYMKRAYAGRPVEIPATSTFASAVPIARKIIYTEPEEPLAETSVVGTVRCNGVPVSGVVVSDGEQVTSTDENGAYELMSWKRLGYVFISVPGGYEVAADGLIPRFFARLDGRDEEVVDFELRRADNDDFTLYVMNDIHLTNTVAQQDIKQFREMFVPDFGRTLAEATGKVYATVLGDMTTDTRWYKNNFALPEYLDEMARVPGMIPIWHVMGNHDNDIRCTGASEVWDMLAVETYRRVIGPNYYSFNLGQVHFVVLDDIVYTGANAYKTYVEDTQLAWLEKDLAYVDPSTPVIVMTHAPLYRCTGLVNGEPAFAKGFANPDQVDWLLEKFAKFERVHFLTAHTHKNYYCKISDRFTEHNNVSVSGPSWQLYGPENQHLSADGTPGGYAIYTFRGKEFSRKYKALGREIDDCQFIVYDLNTVTPKFGGKPGSNELLLNVYNWDPDWRISVRENGRELPVAMSWQSDPLYSQIADGREDLSSAFVPVPLPHLFVATASAADSTVEVECTDSYGNTWKQTVTRPKPFTWDMH
ncbi:MAG: calcineurin-like phosphoesterase family protein [Alistipes sp.]|nr:calcineurin-like phosphoesterase family protein [Alistipes sp.]